MRVVWRVILGLFATIGLLAVLVVVGGGAVAWWLTQHWRSPTTLPERIVLTADLRDDIPEASNPRELLGFRVGRATTLSELVVALDRAAADPRVLGLVAVVDETRRGYAATQELRDAVQRLKAAGKFTLAWADSFGELAPGNRGYYLASAFDEIYLQPAGLVGLTGIAIEQPFLAAFLQRLGIEFQVLRRSEYKTALENLTASQITPPNREMLEAVLASINGQLGDGIAQGRKLPPDRLGELIAGGPYTADAALQLHLIDGVAYRDEVLARAEKRAGGAQQLELADYASALAPVTRPAGTIAVVRAAGTIVRGGDSFSFNIAADDLAQTLKDVAAERGVNAIVLRLSSPGGSPAASETVAHAIRSAVSDGKPVIVSMGNVAASGGYWMALGASRIVAQPATLTGSIGVIAGKPVLANLWEKLDINWSAVAPIAGSDMWSTNRPFTPAESQRLDGLVGDLYGQFKQRVADARGMGMERVEELARGRVWTGAEAAPLRLVDRLGGLHEAVDEARSLLGLPADASVAVVMRPERRWRFAEILRLAQSNLASLTSLARVALSLEQSRPVQMPDLQLQ